MSRQKKMTRHLSSQHQCRPRLPGRGCNGRLRALPGSGWLTKGLLQKPLPFLESYASVPLPVANRLYQLPYRGVGAVQLPERYERAELGALHTAVLVCVRFVECLG